MFTIECKHYDPLKMYTQLQIGIPQTNLLSLEYSHCHSPLFVFLNFGIKTIGILESPNMKTQ